MKSAFYYARHHFNFPDSFYIQEGLYFSFSISRGLATIFHLLNLRMPWAVEPSNVKFSQSLYFVDIDL